MRCPTWVTDSGVESRVADFSTKVLDGVKLACGAALQVGERFALGCTSGIECSNDDPEVGLPYTSRVICPPLHTRALRLSQHGKYQVIAVDKSTETDYRISWNEGLDDVASWHINQFGRDVKELKTASSHMRMEPWQQQRNNLADIINDRMSICAKVLKESPLLRVLLLYEKDFEVFQKVCQTVGWSPYTQVKQGDHHHTATQYHDKAIKEITALDEELSKQRLDNKVTLTKQNFMQYYKQLQSYGIALICNFISPGSIKVEQIRKALEITQPVLEDQTMPIVDSLNVDHPVDAAHQNDISEAWRKLLLDALNTKPSDHPRAYAAAAANPHQSLSSPCQRVATSNDLLSQERGNEVVIDIELV